MNTHYTLQVNNDSLQSGDFCIFQTMPEINIANIVSLAWLSKAASPTTKLLFQWQTDLDFVWTNATTAQSGATVSACQSWPATTIKNNKVELDKVNGAYGFTNQTTSDSPGNLIIEQRPNVLANEISVGIGMGGKATFAVPSQPNMQIMMSPKPNYWLCFGSFKQGESVDVASISKYACKLDFKTTTNMAVSFGVNNCWIIG